MAEKKEELFRKKTLDRISSPEQLSDYLKVSNPGIWAVLTAVILLLGALIAWASIGTLETTADASVIVQSHNAAVICADGTQLAEGMPFRIANEEYVIAYTQQDDFGRIVGFGEASLPDGTYQASVVTETVKPIDFLFTTGR